MRIVFDVLFKKDRRKSPDLLQGCPTPWSKIALNGGFFSLRPSLETYSKLIPARQSTFFKRHHLTEWFDCSEMGPLNELYEDKWQVLNDDICIGTDLARLARKHMRHPFLLHGLKPTRSADERDWVFSQRKYFAGHEKYPQEALAVLDVAFKKLVGLLRHAERVMAKTV